MEHDAWYCFQYDRYHWCFRHFYVVRALVHSYSNGAVCHGGYKCHVAQSASSLGRSNEQTFYGRRSAVYAVFVQDSARGGSGRIIDLAYVYSSLKCILLDI